MSLDPRDSRTRARSKSPGRRDSSRSRPEERERSRQRAPSPPSSRYEDPHDRGYDYAERSNAAIVTAEPRGDRYGAPGGYKEEGARFDMPSMPGGFDDRDDEREKDLRYGGGKTGDRGDKGKDYYKETSYSRKEEYGRPVSPSRYEDPKYTYQKEHTRPAPVPYQDDHHSGSGRGAAFNVATGHHSLSGGIQIAHGHEKHGGRGKYDEGLAYGSPPGPQALQSYADPKKWEYQQHQGDITYSKKQETTTTYNARPASPPEGYYGRNARSSHERLDYRDDRDKKDRRDKRDDRDRRDKKDRRDERDPRDSEYHHERHGSYTGDSANHHERHGSHTGESARTSKSHIVTVDPTSRRRDPSPNPMAGLAPRMHGLSVSTGNHGGASMSLANAPGSPLLEAYHGTYQSISPMPSPLVMASHAPDFDDLGHLSHGSSDDERRGGKKGRRTARFHDPEEEAVILAKALKGDKHAPDTQPLIDILPGLTHEQIIDLRVEYKRIVKTGSDKKGVNIAKHIKLRLKGEDPALMKACYAVALGKWESEAYWANFWYQGEKSRRELLIESLMGRTNREIREIKDGFSDKKYSDSLTKCMKTELKEDKFKKAVLMVLDEKKQEDGRHGVDRHLVEDDVHDLRDAVRSEKGGESKMIGIVVVRSDNHLREVLKLYEQTYKTNFAREMLKKSGNLVVSPPFLPTPSLHN
jgi:hypothetical protein